MRPTFLGFETARKGMGASQKGLDITGQNITNINTPGYSRQRVDFVSSTLTVNSRLKASRVSVSGAGVDISSIRQLRDAFLDTRFRSEFSSGAFYDKSMQLIGGIEGVINELDGGLKTALSDVLSSLQDFSLKPDQSVHANIVQASVKNILQISRNYHVQLEKLSNQYSDELSVSVNNANQLIVKIANLNESIQSIRMSTNHGSDYSGLNELLDQRNLLLDDLAQYGGIHVADKKDGGVVVQFNDHVIIDGEHHDMINLTKAHDQKVVLRYQSTGDAVVSDHGSLMAMSEAINGETKLSKGIPYYQNQLDMFVKAFSDTVNTTFSDDMGDFIPLIEFDGTSFAKDFYIHPDWNSNPDLIVNSGEDSLDNRHILNLIIRLQDKMPIGSQVSALSDFIDNLSTSIGHDISYFHNRFEVSDAILQDLQNRKDATSAVSLDEEGAQLMVFDKAYKASARLMTAMDEALDILINKTGLIGR
jgi:flagellar hook-associated protein 1